MLDPDIRDNAELKRYELPVDGDVAVVTYNLSPPNLMITETLVPERLVRNCGEVLKVVGCPFPVKGFAVSMLWHERNHDHSGQRWVREAVIDMVGKL